MSVDMVSFTEHIHKSNNGVNGTDPSWYIAKYIDHNVDLYNLLKDYIDNPGFEVSIANYGMYDITYRITGLDKETTEKFIEYTQKPIRCFYDSGNLWCINCQIESDDSLLVNMSFNK